ncbi:hypothetical protein FACS1894179_07230 [Bacteroidia bacterium]|nr:hypothetical protein FACS1894179_07230 [Bacteroidia bacterium]
MKVRIILLLFLCSYTFCSCRPKSDKQDNGTTVRLLPVLIENDRNSAKTEISYDDKNRITFFKVIEKSPGLLVITNEIIYKKDSFVIKYKRKEGSEKEYSRIMYCTNNSINVISNMDESMPEYFVINDKNQLSENKAVFDNMVAGQKFEYDEKGRLVKVADFYSETDISGFVKCVYPKEKHINALSHINAPDWLLTYLFNISVSYYSSVKSWRASSSSNGVDYSYSYNDEGYPVSVLSRIVGAKGHTVTLNITYTEAK